jgi:hypothetical protein
MLTSRSREPTCWLHMTTFLSTISNVSSDEYIPSRTFHCGRTTHCSAVKLLSMTHALSWPHASSMVARLYMYSYSCASDWTRLLRRQLVTHTITSSPKVTRFYFQRTSGIYAPVGKMKCCSLSGRGPASIADSFNVATMAREHSVLNLREINRNNTHTALASVLTYYGWVSLIF